MVRVSFAAGQGESLPGRSRTNAAPRARTILPGRTILSDRMTLPSLLSNATSMGQRMQRVWMDEHLLSMTCRPPESRRRPFAFCKGESRTSKLPKSKCLVQTCTSCNQITTPGLKRSTVMVLSCCNEIGAA